MILVTDVQYKTEGATAAGILFSDWVSDKVEQQIIQQIEEIAPYEAGSFYQRELPCILALLSLVETELEAIIIDGFVNLGVEQKAGLGMHLYQSINRSIPVIGVAKNQFTGTPKDCQIFRGKSLKPLYITSVGIPLEKAKSLTLSMHGANRIPTLLKKVDRLCRHNDVKEE